MAVVLQMIGIRNKLLEWPFLGAFLLMICFSGFMFLSVVSIALIFGRENLMNVLYLVFIAQFSAQVVLWFVVVPFVFHLPNGKESFRQYLSTIRLSKIQPLAHNLILGILCALVIFACMLCSSLIAGGYVFDPNRVFPPNSWMIVIAFIPGIWEEVAFRGAILALLLRKYSERKAILIDAAMFSAIHSLNLLGRMNDYLAWLFIGSQVVYTFFAGIFLGYLLIKSKSLLPCMITHYLVDAFGSLFLYSPNIDPLIIAILDAILGAGLVPAVINILIIKLITKRLSYTE